MCGFICIVGKNQNKIVSKNKIISVGFKYLHRGPDAQNYYFDDQFKCFFRRLSIIDLHNRSDQPFQSNNNRYLMVFNGEIYNFNILKKELISYGFSFKTKGDTEVLLKAFEVWGKKFVHKLRGMFAICIWDKKLKRFYAFRDRFGIKPLYYSIYKNNFFFSSEIKDIYHLIEKKKFVENKKVISNYLANSFLNDTDETFFKDIYSLKPGHMVEIIDFKISFKKYWSLKYSEKNLYDKNKITNLLKNTLDLHTISDVPIAYTLSGGIDSSLLAGVSAKMSKFNKKTKFFSVIPKFTTNEKLWIDSTVKKFQLNHFYLNIKDKGLDDFEKFINFQDEPVQTASAYYQFLLRKEIKKHNLKVLIVGEGADEVFGGYKRCLFYYLQFMNFKKKGILSYLKMSEKFMQSDVDSILNKYIKFKSIIKKNTSDLEDISSRSFLNNKLRFNLKFLDVPSHSKNFFKDALISHMTKRDLPYVLRMEDKNSMSQGIESRVPFLDHELVEYIYQLKTKYFMEKGKNKYILRDAFKKYFSKKVVNRYDKSARPGNNGYFIFNRFFGEFIDLLNKNDQNNYFDSRKIKLQFERDKKNNFFAHSDFYFRSFNYLVWKDRFKI